ncbi:hypothetical protein GCM10027287_28350 [Bordetella muralis]
MITLPAPSGAARMPTKRTTINTITLTCSACGSSQFTKLATNEYRCNHCQAVTLVEDDVAQRLEKILRGMQQPQPAPVQIKPAAIAIIIAAVAAVFLVPLVMTLLHDSSTPVPRYEPEKPIDPALIKLTDVQNIKTGRGRELVMLMHNDTGRDINAPTVSATFYRDALTLSSTSGSPVANTLLPGEYAPVRLSMPDEPFTRYELKVQRVSPTDRISRAVVAEKVQLVLNDGTYRLVGLARNIEMGTARSARIVVTLYGKDGRIIGVGSGYGVANELGPNAATPFDVRCDMFSDEKVASYDYMVQSEG